MCRPTPCTTTTWSVRKQAAGTRTSTCNGPWKTPAAGFALVNYRWGSTISTGVMSITAPSGKYFFEDGISKTTLKFSREVIEMIGYGDDKTFFGWIVLNRRDLMTTSRYGKFQQILVTGIVTGTTSSASVRFLCFDGSKSVSVSRLGKGMYRIYLPSTWGLSEPLPRHGYRNLFHGGKHSDLFRR